MRAVDKWPDAYDLNDGCVRSFPTTERHQQWRLARYNIFGSARRDGIADDDIRHAVGNAPVAGEQDDGKVLYLGADLAGNLLEVVSVV